MTPGIGAFETTRLRLDQPLYTGAPNRIDESVLFRRLSSAIARNRLSNGGPLVAEFEERVAALNGAAHCVAVCNGTTALQLLAKALGLDGEVIMPSLTFPATPHSVAWLGIEPVFSDVERSTASIDPMSVERLIGVRTSAVMGVHLWGRLCVLEPLEKLSERYDVPLVFDAAHAFGCAIAGQSLGELGLASVLSFHATKIVSAFEGGAVLTHDSTLADEIRSLQNFGYDGGGRFARPGTNAKMSEASAAMGLTSLDAYPHVVEHNRLVHERYAEGLSGVSGITMTRYDDQEQNNYQYAIIEVAPEVGRGILQQTLTAANVHTRRYFSPGCHELAPYRSARRTKMPSTEAIAARVLALPTGTQTGLDHVDAICAIIQDAAEERFIPS